MSGTRFTIRVEFPFTRRMLSLWNRCLMAVLSSAPLCLARAPPSFLTSLMAASCHPPRLSRARGTNTIPSSKHLSPAAFHFLEKASCAPWPGVVAKVHVRSRSSRTSRQIQALSSYWQPSDQFEFGKLVGTVPHPRRPSRPMCNHVG